MFNLLRAELLKQKGKFRIKLLIIAPIITILLSLLLNSANVQNGSYNWWYFLILPATITIVTCFSTASEKRNNRHGMFGVVVQKEKLWLAEVILNTVYLFITVLVFFILISTTGLVLDKQITILQSFYASLVLFICFAWQIPLWMWITEMVGPYTTLLVSIFFNIGMAITFSTTNKWWMPFAIPSRLMCPILGIHPNGLWVENGSYLMDSGVIPMGLVISVFAYIIMITVTGFWFKYKEV